MGDVPNRKSPARRLDNRATLERQTTAYFEGLTAQAAAEETDLEDALSAATEEMDFDRTPVSDILWAWS
jgi:hypothetical protein